MAGEGEEHGEVTVVMVLGGKGVSGHFHVFLLWVLRT